MFLLTSKMLYSVKKCKLKLFYIYLNIKIRFYKDIPPSKMAAVISKILIYIIL